MDAPQGAPAEEYLIHLEAPLDEEYEVFYSIPEGFRAISHRSIDNRVAINLLRIGFNNPNLVDFAKQKRIINLLDSSNPASLNAILPMNNGGTLLDLVYQRQTKAGSQYHAQYQDLIELLKAKGAQRSMPPIVEKLP